MTDPTEILNWRRLDERITTSGQPGEAQLAEIAVLGVNRIINLGLHTHRMALPDEGASVAGLGMTYVHIPVEFDAPTEADFQRFCAAMGEADGQPVHVHCIVNARVTAFLYRYRTEVLGVSQTEAQAMLESVWRPGGVWASFIGDEAGVERTHEYAGRDY
jgi:uncharacterized protein (TIGR01244 family)